MAYTLEEQKAHRKLWIAALRSGKFEQGINRLHTLNDTYCCLGVACEVAMANGLDVTRTRDLDSYFYDKYDNTFPPYSVSEFFGLRTNNGSYKKDNGEETSLVVNNDDDRLTFDQIADIIESEPEGLFY